MQHLTGAVLIALGDRASGIMGNDDKLIKEIKKSSNNTDEKVWELTFMGRIFKRY